MKLNLTLHFSATVLFVLDDAHCIHSLLGGLLTTFVLPELSLYCFAHHFHQIFRLLFLNAISKSLLRWQDNLICLLSLFILAFSTSFFVGAVAVLLSDFSRVLSFTVTAGTASSSTMIGKCIFIF